LNVSERIRQPGHEHERLISVCRKEKQTLYEKFIGGEISADDYKTAKVAQNVEIARLNQAHTALKKAAAAHKTDKQLNELMEVSLRENVLSRELVELLIDGVRFFPGGQVEVVWNRGIILDGHTA
jgi:hypothetical protein